ncbi:MAG: hypothetical protein WCG26_00180 [Chloroflexales bacterium]
MAELVTMSPPDVGDRMKELSRLFPAEMRAALGRAGAAYRSRLRRVMAVGGGQFGVPPLAPLAALSLELRKRRTIGGELAKSSAIQMYANGGVMVVGWITALNKWASSIQDSESRSMSSQEKHFLYQRLGSQQSRKQSLKTEASALRGEAKMRSSAGRKALRRGVLFAGLIARRQQVLAGGLRDMAKQNLKEARALTGERSMVPTTYYRPRRPVIVPFADAHRAEFPRWIEGAAVKLLARKLGSQVRQGSFVQEPAAS